MELDDFEALSFDCYGTLTVTTPTGWTAREASERRRQVPQKVR